MFFVRKPSNDQIREILARVGELDFAYDGVGSTRETPPDGHQVDGYQIDRTRVEIGRGASAFSAARHALQSWRQVELSWLSALPALAPIVERATIAMVARSMGCWWVNPCRIVYVIDDHGDQPRFGYANGALPGHATMGEERFLVEMDRDEKVHYDIFAFSRPQQLLSKLGSPYLRHIQKRFGRQSAAAMQAAVSSS